MDDKLQKIVILTSKLLFYMSLITQSISIGYASELETQHKPLNEIEIELEPLEDVPLIHLIDYLEKKTDFRFAYPSKLVRHKNVTFEKGSWNMKSLLQKVSSQAHLTIKRINESIVLTERGEGLDTPLVSEQIVLNVPVNGQVVDENEEPLPGATVLEKGTLNGTVTDIDGNFSLNVQEGATLEVSFIGYFTKEVAVNSQSNITVQLAFNVANLDEVVVVGFGTQQKKDLTGAVISANIADFKESPNTNVMQSLQGTVPGLNIGQINSAGATPDISIRGRNTINGNSSVLIVLDGIQYSGSLSSINPDDIASIDVLKDASSKAVYGAQAGNGVILITTKKGKIDTTPEISFSTSFTTQTPTVDLRPMKREQYINHVRDLFWDQSYDLTDGSLNPDYDVTNGFAPVFLDSDRNLLENDYDWWEEGTEPGSIVKNQLNVKGGSNNLSYLISGGLTDQSGFIVGDEFQRKSLRVNLETQATPWLKLGVQSFGSFVNQDGASPNLSSLMKQSPLLLPYDQEGNLVINPFNTLDVNPFTSSDVDNLQRRNYFFANIYSVVDIPFVRGLSYRFNYGQNYRLEKDYGASIYGAGLTGSAYKNNASYYDYTFDNIITYDKRIGADHQLNTTLLYGVIERQFSKTEASARGFPRLNLGYNSLEQGEIQNNSSSAWAEALNYQMFRVNYKFKSRYLLTATVRRDGYSGFAANEKYALFPSVALGWVVSDEFILPNWVDFIKVRGGYGVSGNQTGRYSSLALLGSNNAYTFGDGGITLIGQEVQSLVNPNLRWEKTSGINLGMDFDVLGGRISGNLDYYNNETNDLLFDVVLPRLSGFSVIRSNVGRLKNSGFEAIITSINVDKPDFRWSSTLTFSTNSNEVAELLGIDADGDGIEDDLTASGLFIGQPLGAIYDYEVNGIYQLDDDIPEGYYPGTYRIVDQDNTDTYNVNPADDRVILGRTDPAYRAGILNKFEYKGFSLSVFINTIQGGKDGYIGRNNRAISRGTNTLIWNYISEIDYWTPGNPGGEYPQSVSTPSITPSAYYDRSFVRLQDVILSYKFPRELLDNMNIKDLNVFVSGKNLATWTKWKGWDPETNIKNSSGEITNYGTGYQDGGRPVMQGYSIGLNITL